LPAHAAIEDALCVLEYYGLSLDNPSVIRLDHLDTEGQVYANLFLKDLTSVGEAASFVVEHLKQNPERETLFLFASMSYDIKFMSQNNPLRNVLHDSQEFVRIGSEEDCSGHFV
jgi:hypothetical protein